VRFRSTFALLGIFLLLGGYVYFTEYRGRDERAQKEATKKKLFPAELKDMVELSLVYPDHRISAVRKDDKNWEITDPKGIDADSEAWEMLASSIGQIEKEETVVSTNPDLAVYGLDKPAIQVTAKMKDGHSVGVLFGGENPSKSQNYAKLVDGTEVFLSPVNWSRTFQKTLTDMRNKKVLDFALDDINGVRIDDGKNPMEFQKSGMDWLLKKPSELKADGAEVSGFLSAIQSARALSFAGDETTPSTAGLMPPAVRITLHDGKASKDRILSLGKSPEVDKYYASNDTRPGIFVIDKEVPGKARRPLTDWRDRTIAHLDHDAADKIDEIEISRGKEKVLLKKQGTDWKMSDGRKAQSDKITNVLIMLEFERASQIVDTPVSLATYGLDKPRLAVTLRQSGKDVLGLQFGNATRNPEGSYLKVSQSSAVMTVTADLYDKFNLKADDLAEGQPATK